MNRYNHPLNNPHIFFFELRNEKTCDVAYTLPYSIDNEPTEQDVDDIAKHLVEAIKTKRESLGWNHSDLFYGISYLSPLQSGSVCLGCAMKNGLFHEAPKREVKESWWTARRVQVAATLVAMATALTVGIVSHNLACALLAVVISLIILFNRK